METLLKYAVKSLTFTAVEHMWNLLRKVLLLAYICLDFAFKSASSDRSSHIICPRYEKARKQ